MLHVVTPAFGRASAHRKTWPYIRARAGMDIHWIIAIDGSKKVKFHEVQKNINSARKYADEVLILGSHVGNGATMQKAHLQIARALPRVSLDADILPSQDFALNMYQQAQEVDDGALGALYALPLGRRRIGVTLRKAAVGQRFCTQCFYITARGQAAIGDHTTDIPLGGYERLVASRLHSAGLWFAYTELAYIDDHSTKDEPFETAYNQWRVPYVPNGDRAKLHR